MPRVSDSSYDRHRRVGQGQADSAGQFRPRLGAEIELFGTPVTLGPQHALGLLAAGVFAGLEGVVAVVVIFLGWLLYKSQPQTAPVATENPPTSGSTSGRRPPQRQPGLWGAIMHFIGPVPEGPPIAMGDALQGTAAAPADGGVVSQPQPRPSPPPAPAASSWTEADEAKARAARSAAARAAAARAEAREKAEHPMGAGGTS